MERIYQYILQEHLQHDRQMVFLAGPRQVGKTTISRTAASLTQQLIYLNWDYEEDQQLILAGPQAILNHYHLLVPQALRPILIFDEIHKLKRWRNYLKGFYDKYTELMHFIVTGSAKLDIYRRSGDSLMGRYFPYRVHPLSVAELKRTIPADGDIQLPQPLATDLFTALIQFGGFPEPFTRQNKPFYQRWNKLRSEQLFQLDIRELTRIHELAQMQLLASILKRQAGELINYSSLAKLVRVSADTIQVWINTLQSFYYCFEIKPWRKNITRSLIKQPKIYLWNWADGEDIGARHENMIASHLLKAVHLWEDRGLGEYGLYFLRDKEKREVDFLVTKNNRPWFLVEVKSQDTHSVSENLYYFQKQTQALHAFQVVIGMPYREIDCFEYHTPIIVPALTFLSQLV
ncbi:MAG: ATP-binding protein [Proteobacteria bacterium]|nr:ATP-binding protein [Pseudomonadota bacterium]